MNFVPPSKALLTRQSCSHALRCTFKESLSLQAGLTTRSSPRRGRWIASANRRRKNVGVPKNVQIEPVGRQLRADESPWEDYLIPELRGNSQPRRPERYTEPCAPFFVLGVESSCDDTAAAVVRSDGLILGEACVSQDELTEQWGGVVPHVAREAHERAIVKVISEALNRASILESDLSAVAATMGPGLEVCLRVGYRAARAVARRNHLDFVAVNHLEAHLLVSRMPQDGQRILKPNTPQFFDEPGETTAEKSFLPFPFLTLLVSGGHCQLLLVRGVADYEVLGGTLDDALGEAFDKTARLLGLQVGGGGGPALEALAREGNPKAIPFPVPMSKRADCNFSFAGLKTSVRVAIDKLGGDTTVRANRTMMCDIAASFQEIAVQHLEQRVRRAINLCSRQLHDIDTLVVSGGVAANITVRSRLTKLCEDSGWRCVVPPIRLCTDNGVMVAWTGIERLRLGIADDTCHLDVRARWPLAGLGELATPLPPDVS